MSKVVHCCYVPLNRSVSLTKNDIKRVYGIMEINSYLSQLQQFS